MVWRAAIMASPAPREARVASQAMGFRSRCQATAPCTSVTPSSSDAGEFIALNANRATPKPRPQAKIHFNRQFTSSHARLNIAMISVIWPRLIHALR